MTLAPSPEDARLADALERLARARAIARELRVPFTPILLRAGDLSSGASRALPQREDLERMAHSAGRIVALLDELEDVLTPAGDSPARPA